MGLRDRRVLAATALFAFAQLAIVLGGFADNGALCDDAFYYFQVARNAAHGAGFSFDGVYATNGFHPLLAWIAVPVFAVFDSPWLPIHLLLCLLAVATAMTAYVMFRIGRALGDERAGELMAVFFLLSPFTWIIPLRGCEAGLSVLCIALAVLQAARIREVDVHGVAILGALVGLAGLARTENVLLGVAMFGWLIARTRRPRHLLAFASAALVVVSPWLIWNLVRFGTIVQVSGAAKTQFHLYHPLRGYLGVPFDMLAHAIQFVAGEEFQPRRRTIALAITSVVLVAIAVAVGGRRRPPPALVPVAALVGLHVAFYGYLQRSYFNWYAMPVVFGAAVLQGERLARARRGIVGALVVVAAVQCAITLGSFANAYRRSPRAPERRVEARLARIAMLPDHARLAGWNVGAIGYFTAIRRPDITLFNLDCVVNNELFAAWRRGEYMQWIAERVDWLVEHPQGHFAASAAVPDGNLWRIR